MYFIRVGVVNADQYKRDTLQADPCEVREYDNGYVLLISNNVSERMHVLLQPDPELQPDQRWLLVCSNRRYLIKIATEAGA